MKAHIQRLAASKILFYSNGQADKSQAVAAFCQKEKIPFQEVSFSQMGDSLGFLAGVSGFSPAEKPWSDPVPQQDALIFCGMDEKRVRQLLDKMNQLPLRIELKAVMTSHNQGWPFGALLVELEKEHLALHRQATAPAQDS